MSFFLLDSQTAKEVQAGRLPSNPYVDPAEAFAAVYGTRTQGRKPCHTHDEDRDVGMHDSDDEPYPPTDLDDQDAVRDSFLGFMLRFYRMPVTAHPRIKVEINSIAPELREKHTSSAVDYHLFHVLTAEELLNKIRSQISRDKSSRKLRDPGTIMYRFMTPIEFGDSEWNLYRDVNARHHDGSSNAADCETWYTKFLIKFLDQCNHIGQVLSQAAEQKTQSGEFEKEIIRNVCAKVIIWYDDARTTEKGWTGAHLRELGIDLDSPDAVDRLNDTNDDDKMMLD